MDNRRLILLLVFSFSLIMLWDAWQKQSQPKLAPTAKTAPMAGAAAGAVPTPTLPPAGPAAVPGAVPGSAAVVAGAATAKIRTDLYVVEISSLGGDITRLELVRHPETEDKSKNFLLFDNGGKHIYLGQSGVIGEGMPNHKTEWKLVAGEHVLKDGEQKLEVRLEAPAANGGKVAKTYVFQRGSYQIEVRHEGVAPGAHAYYQITRDGKPAGGESNSMMMGVVTFTGPAVFTDAEKFQKVEFADILKNKAKFAQKADNGWLAMVQHYFVAAWLPAAGTQREYFMRKVGEDLYSAGVILPLVGNWGWAIIGLTILIKAIFFPLSAASYRSMAKLRVVTPRMQQIKERHGGDRVRMQQEMMELYKTEKINPLGGCLPIVVQIPVFIALYWVLLGSVEMRNAPWIGWITDLSIKDPYFVLPLLMGVTMFVQTKLNPTPPDPIQAKVMLFLPVMFHRHVPVLPVRPGAVLDGQQHSVDCTAVADHADDRGGREEVVALPVASDRGDRRRLSR
jgi:YidC/Oxa1 family membrane protein insertase